MSIDEHATYQTMDGLQLAGDYDGLLEIAQYAIDAITNDDVGIIMDCGTFTVTNPTLTAVKPQDLELFNAIEEIGRKN